MKLAVLALLALGAGVAWGWTSSEEGGRSRMFIHLDEMRRLSPIAASAWFSASALGWSLRRRAGRGRMHASPTLAWLAKRMAWGALILSGIYALSPVAWPVWVIYLAVGSGCGGWGVYLAHLPPKL